MKYIRTNKGKIYVRNDLHQSKELIGNVLVDIKGWCIYPEDILKQTDTIEELCDEFVVREFHYPGWFPIKVEAHNSYDVYRDFEEALTYRNRLAKYKGSALYDLYGAIWTDKGLIYVAKMNEKGKLCLI